MNLLRRLFPRTIKAKYNTIIFIAVLSLIVIVIGTTYVQKKKAFYLSIENLLENQVSRVESKIAERSITALSMADMIVTDKTIQKAVADHDKDALQELTLERFKSFSKQSGMQQLHFHLPPATSLFRAHKPEKSGDDLSDIRPGIVEVNRTRNDMQGLEKGRFGYGIRGIKPVFYEGKHVGSVELGASLNDAFVQSIKAETGYDISVVVPDGGEFRFQAKTHDFSIPKESYPLLQNVLTGDTILFSRVKKDEKQMMTAYKPIKDYGGTNVGVLAIPVDIMPMLKKLNKELLFMSGLSLAIFILLILIVSFTFNLLIGRPMKMVIEKFNAAGKGDLTQQIDVRPLINCSEIVQCNKEGCSCFGQETRCWETAGSFSANIECPKILDGHYQSCQDCTEVYKQARLDEMQELSCYFNAFIYSTRLLINEMNDSIRQMTGTSKEMSSSANEMQQSVRNASRDAQHVAEAAETMSNNMNSVAAASEEATTNVNVVATATDSMSAQFATIAKNTEEANTITTKAVSRAQSAQEKVDVLGTSASEISKVTETISEISEQTNLLALNATIEAARAGEAGKGFAVVANEIKDLAKQTSESTQEIRNRIEDIQNSTEMTITEIKEISQVIDQVNAIVTEIATSIEEQTETTAEIGSNVSQAAQGIGEVNQHVAESSAMSGDIATNIANVSHVTETISNNASTVLNHAEQLALLADKLSESMVRFKVEK